MDDRDRLLRAIEAEPEDDAVRLVYADWLEEHGDDDRARFIRLQCEHHRLYGRTYPPVESAHREELEREIEALLGRHRDAWTAGLPAWCRERFERGFLNIFHLTGKQFLETAGAIRAVAPLPSLFLRRLKGREVAVLTSEHLAGMSRLWLEGAQLTDAGVAALTSSPHLDRVDLLGLARCPNGDADDANKLTNVSAFALARADNLPSLTALELSGYKGITADGVQALVGSVQRAGLTELNLSGGTGGPALAEAFRGSVCRLTNLEQLMLNNRNLGDHGAEALAEAVSLRGLRLLWLAGNKIGDRGATALASSPHFAELTDLDLFNNNVTDAGVRAIIASSGLRGIRSLQLGENPKITDAGARAILDDGRAWRVVGLDGTQVSPALREEIAARSIR